MMKAIYLEKGTQTMRCPWLMADRHEHRANILVEPERSHKLAIARKTDFELTDEQGSELTDKLLDTLSGDRGHDFKIITCHTK